MHLNFYQTQQIDKLISDTDAIAAEKEKNTCCLMKILQNVVFLSETRPCAT